MPCCAWQPTAWASTYMAITGVTLLWTVFLVSQACDIQLTAQGWTPPVVEVARSPVLERCACDSTTLHRAAAQMRTFVISGTVAQWYFSPANSRAREVCGFS